MAARARAAHRKALIGSDGTWDSYGVYSDKAWAASLNEYRTALIDADTDYRSLVSEMSDAKAEITWLQRENATLRDDVARAVETIDVLIAQRYAAQKDRDRLNWFERQESA